MSTTALVDLASIPMPDAVEVLDYETILAARKAGFVALYPEDQQAEVAATLELESEPVARLLQESSYRELVWRQRANDAVRAVMLAYAEKADLDNAGANLNVTRLVVTPADDTTVPPTPAVMESDTDFRYRCQLSFQGYSTAGSRGGYLFHSLSADGQVKDASPTSPAPGVIVVYVMSRTGDGTAGDDLLKKVTAALSVEDTRPMNDDVDVRSVSIVNYEVVAEIEMYDGPDGDAVINAAQADAEAYAESLHYIGKDVALSGFYKALHQPGAVKANISVPTNDIEISDGQTAFCTGITITKRIKPNA
ncbi:baseplate J/gp47 family protein [Burkholderia plantarii]|uniref:baseplate J/gp47 family protein n=1 Tax=Burkholderia plantarii TaxID=41899 RepID=UPI00272BF0C5|nr:baseplate J/gp47 family protein [Burkholderia plantarii]WLE59279.1 baseplate J/gp47 family protein [Burkholderia plantarii]